MDVGYYMFPNGVQAQDITRYLDFNCGNAVKYACRAGRKRELGKDDKEKAVEDLQKAIDYLEDEVRLIEGRSVHDE